ncbi:MAG: dockerin type I repeat-containing protein [Oscillospiraceae bacterium]|nr:dockerin type I repeat-containing protein [Oscillospiraceae bacterium]
MKKTLAVLLSLALVSMNFSAVVTIAENSSEMLVQTSEEDSVLASGLHTVIGTGTYADGYILDNGCCITDLNIEEYAETPFKLKYGDVVEIDCDTATGTFPKYYEFDPGVRIRFMGKAEDYYKDNLQELVVKEVQEDKFILAEKNPENPENPAVYEMSRLHLYLRDCFAGMLGDFNMEEAEVGDYGVFAVNPDTQEVICAVEVHYGNPIDTSQTIELQVREVWSDSLILKDMETEKYYKLELNNKAVSVMDKKTLQTLSLGDVLLLTVDSEGNPEIPLEVTYEATVEDFIKSGMLYTVIGVNEDGTEFFLDNDCSLSLREIEDHAETPFTPEYGDLVCVEWTCIFETFPGQFGLSPGVRIYYVGKAGDYYKDNLKELVVMEVQDYKIILAEKNPEDSENSAVYQLTKVNPLVESWTEQDDFLTEGYYWAKLDGFDVDTLAVGDSGVFAVNPDKNKIIAAVEIHAGENSENSGNSTLAKGDVNGNGEVDITDVILINRIYVGLEKVSKEQQEAGDIDKNGKVDLTDSMLVLRYLVGLEDSLDF